MMNEKPDAIVITFPVKFLLDIADTTPLESPNVNVWWPNMFTVKQRILVGYGLLVKMVNQTMQQPDDGVWYHSIGNKPQQEVLYAFVSCLGIIRWRANIVDWLPGGEIEFDDGRKKTAKHWLMLADFVKAPTELPFKGCQGFRYTHKIF